MDSVLQVVEEYESRKKCEKCRRRVWRGTSLCYRHRLTRIYTDLRKRKDAVVTFDNDAFVRWAYRNRPDKRIYRMSIAHVEDNIYTLDNLVWQDVSETLRKQGLQKHVRKGFRKCYICERSFPLNPTYFYRNRRGFRGFGNRCKRCEDQQKLLRRAARREAERPEGEGNAAE